MKLASFLLVALSLVLCTSVVQAQNFTLTADAADGFAGDTVNATILLDSDAVVQGWSFGVCSDDAVLAIGAVVDGATTATVAGGSPPDFNQVNVVAGGWTVGVVISFLGTFSLDPGTGLELNVASYELVGADGDISALAFCDTLGTPPVSSVVVTGGASVTPTFVDGSIEILVFTGPEPFTYIAPDGAVDYDPTDGAVTFDVTVQIVQSEGGIYDGVTPADTQGFSMGLSNDPLAITPMALTSVLPFTPDFFGEGLQADGWTIGVVYAFLGGVFLVVDAPTDVITVTYDSVPAYLNGDLDGAIADLIWTDTLGTPPVTNVVVVGGASLGTEADDGVITFNPVIDVPFIRGDTNGDLIVNIADGVWIINELFLSGPVNPCAEAGDANDDDIFDQSDAIYIFNYRFLGGPPPAAPFPDCAPVSGADCEASACP